MAKYIDVEKAKEKENGAFISRVKDYCNAEKNISRHELELELVLHNHLMEVLDFLPAEDVRKERHGHWAKRKGMVVCSECGREGLANFDAPYCAYCGALMDGKEADK